METGKVIAVTGLNASGKTMFADRLRKQLASDKVRYIAFCDSYGANTDRAYYLQQRWNQHDIDEETPTVGARLEKIFLETGPDIPERRALQAHLYELFGMKTLLHEYLIILSSGELRKFQLIKTLLANPSILILDNPYIGLDTIARGQLNDLIALLANEENITIYLLLSRHADIPAYADERIWTTPELQLKQKPAALSVEKRQALTTMVGSHLVSPSDIVVEMHDVSIRYGSRTILKGLDWLIRKNEKWALFGPNGSGKSTLLSLVTADNPQAYACNISLFGNQRGTGETIWEIKRRIGYVSPEMHRSYQRNLPSVQVVASGLKDTIGLYVRPNQQEKALCLWWMRIFGIESLADRSFMELSSGQQRLVLLARSLVKDPELLILDEPMHGLDAFNQQLVTDIIENFCSRPDKTLIYVTHYKEELPSCINHSMTLIKQQ